MKRNFLIFLTVILLSCNFAWADLLAIEHQIRLCEDQDSILSKLQLKESSGKVRDIVYLETSDQMYRQKGWTLRLKIKSNKIEVDVKKRYAADEAIVLKNLECELDQHVKQTKTCKINHETSLLKFSSVLAGTSKWHELLSTEQVDWLKENLVFTENTKIFGTLINKRFEFDTFDLGTVTLDTVHLKNSESVTFHEISIRYPQTESLKKSKMFEGFIKTKGLVPCVNQEDWDIDKFDVMNSL